MYNTRKATGLAEDIWNAYLPFYDPIDMIDDAEDFNGGDWEDSVHDMVLMMIGEGEVDPEDTVSVAEALIERMEDYLAVREMVGDENSE